MLFRSQTPNPLLLFWRVVLLKYHLNKMGDQDGEQRIYKITVYEPQVEERVSSRGFTGKGKAEYPNGDIYEGDFKDGLKHGEGRYTWVNGDVYEGAYSKDKKQGIGKMVYLNEGHYFGIFGLT